MGLQLLTSFIFFNIIFQALNFNQGYSWCLLFLSTSTQMLKTERVIFTCYQLFELFSETFLTVSKLKLYTDNQIKSFCVLST